MLVEDEQLRPVLGDVVERCGSKMWPSPQREEEQPGLPGILC